MHWSEKTPILFYNQWKQWTTEKKKKNFELKGLVPMKKPTLWELTKEGTFFQLRETLILSMKI